MKHLTELMERISNLSTQIALWDRKVDEEIKKLCGKDATNPDDEYLNKLLDKDFVMLALSRAGADPHEDLWDVLDEVCNLYLKSTPEQRNIIRSMFDEQHNHNILSAMYGYIYRASEMLQDTGDVKWLRMGLAAASIEDKRVDHRDLTLALGDLYIAADYVRINPLPHFKEIANLSNTAGEHSTHDFLANFHQSPFFETSVYPRLRSTGYHFFYLTPPTA